MLVCSWSGGAATTAAGWPRKQPIHSLAAENNSSSVAEPAVPSVRLVAIGLDPAPFPPGDIHQVSVAATLINREVAVVAQAKQDVAAVW